MRYLNSSLEIDIKRIANCFEKHMQLVNEPIFVLKQYNKIYSTKQELVNKWIHEERNDKPVMQPTRGLTVIPKWPEPAAPMIDPILNMVLNYVREAIFTKWGYIFTKAKKCLYISNVPATVLLRKAPDHFQLIYWLGAKTSESDVVEICSLGKLDWIITAVPSCKTHYINLRKSKPRTLGSFTQLKKSLKHLKCENCVFHCCHLPSHWWQVHWRQL